MFEEEGALDRLEAFASLNGPHFYRLPPNETRVTLGASRSPVPERIGEGDSAVVPFRAGETLALAAGWLSFAGHTSVRPAFFATGRRQVYT